MTTPKMIRHKGSLYRIAQDIDWKYVKKALGSGVDAMKNAKKAAKEGDKEKFADQLQFAMASMDIVLKKIGMGKEADAMQHIEAALKKWGLE